MLARFLQEEEGRLVVDGVHLVKLCLADVGYGFFEHLAHGVDGNVRPAHGVHGLCKKPLHSASTRQITLQRHGLCAQRTHCGHRGLRLGP